MEEFDLCTDHQALRWIFSLADGSSRWQLMLMGHRFKVNYKRGSHNTVADAISRPPTYGECPVGPDLDVLSLSVEIAEDPFTPERGAVDD